MKKTVCLVFSLVFLIAALNVTAFAASRESENNNDFTKADLISVNETVTGAISDGIDTDWYKFTLSKAGKVTVKLEHTVLASTSDYWRVSLYKSDGVSGILGSSTEWTVSGNASLETPGVGLDKGTYFVKISPYTDYRYEKSDYKLTVSFTASDAWETEDNSEYASADLISLNKEYSGVILRDNDVDWYHFQLASDGVITVDFSHTIFATTSEYWRFYIYRSDGVTEFCSSADCWYVAGNENMSTCEIGLKKGDYYLKVLPYSNYRYKDDVYKFRINFKSSAVWEKEDNDSYETYTFLSANTDFYGSTCNDGDTDWYCLSLSKASTVTLTFTHPNIASSNPMWIIHLYSANGTDGVTGKDCSFEVTGDANCALCPLTLPAGKYYIKITPYAYYRYSAATYTLRAEVEDAADTELEPDGDVGRATEISTDTEYVGSIFSENDEDYYKFTLPSDCSVTVLLTKKYDYETDINLCLYGGSGTSLIGSNEHISGSDKKYAVEYTLSAGTYYIAVWPYASYRYALGQYGLTVLVDHVHTPGAWTVKIDPDCLREGLKTSPCTVCGLLCSETIPAEGHTYGEWIEQYAPTCESEGYKYRECTKCGDSHGEYVPALGHKYGGWTVAYEATCSSEGVEKIVCSRCGDTKKRYTDMIEHTFGEPERIEGNIFDYPMIYKKECVNCGYYETYEDNKARWAAPVIIAGGVLILAGLVLFIVLYARKSMKAYASAQNYPPTPAVPSAAPTSAVSGFNADGSVNCVCGQINSPDAMFCRACGRKLKGQEK